MKFPATLLLSSSHVFNRKTGLFLLSFLCFHTTLVKAQNVSYVPLHNNTAFNNRTINTSLPVGSLQGAAEVSGSGGSSYSFPVIAPPGTNGVSPAVTVFYSSQGGNGIAGMGWSIGGLSFISRTSRNMYFDGEANPVEMDARDRFTLDGSRLILKTGTYGSDGATYGKETEDFATITSKGTQGNGPEWFEVTTKEGVIMHYGSSPDARLSGQYATVLTWALKKIIYPDGNYILFQYKTNAYFHLIPEEIQYTGNDAAGLTPYNKIRFEYKLRTADPNTVFEKGTRIDSKYLLDKIITYAENQTALTYQFVYAQNSVSSFLNEVVLSGSDGSSLNSTLFKYGEFNAEVQLLNSPPYTNPASSTLTGDFNADGITDFLAGRQEGSVYRVSLYTKNPQTSTNPQGFHLAYETDLPLGYSMFKKKEIPDAYGLFSYDFTGDGADDMILTNISGTGSNRTLTDIRIYQSIQNYNWPGNGNPQVSLLQTLVINPYSGFSKIHSSGNFLFTGDFNGDGIQDMLTTLGTPSGSYYGHIYFTGISSGFLTIGLSGPVSIPLADWAGADKISVLDFNGDGKSDIMVIKGTACEIYTFDGFTGRRIFYSPYDQFLKSNALLHFGDFNGDQKTDILAKSTVSGIWKILISTGETFLEAPFTFAVTPDTDPVSGDQLLVADLNGDRLADVYHAYDPVGSSHTYYDIYYGKGYSYDNSTASFYKITEAFVTNLGAPPPMTGDFDGDGKVDILSYKNAATPMDFQYFRKDGTENFLEKVKDGFNRTSTWTYKKLTHDTTFYQRGMLQTYPVSAVTPPMYAVSASATQQTVNSFETIEYTYARALLHRAGKGFLGFGDRTLSNTLLGEKTLETSLINSTFYALFPQQLIKTHLPSSTHLGASYFSYDFISPASKRFWMKLTSSTDADYLRSIHTSVQNTWDNYGNVIASQTTLSNGTATLETGQANYSFGTYAGTVPNKVQSETITQTRAGEAPFSLTTTYSYNTLGQITSKTDFSGLPKSIQTDFEYFPTGNLKKTTVTPSGMPLRNSTVTYDSKARFPITQTNELGQTSQAVFEPLWGSPVSSTGIDGLTTTYEYDPFGVVKKTTLPEGYSITETKVWFLIGTSCWFSMVTQPGKPMTSTYYDLTGREVKKQVQAFSANPLDMIEYVKVYDNSGKLTYESSPAAPGETGLREFNYIYDTYHRLVSIYDDQNPEVGETEFSYSLNQNNLQVTTIRKDLLNNTSQSSSKVTDASGKTIRATDNGGTLEYSYYSHGGLKEIQKGGTTLNSMTYDTQGRQTGLTDADAGTTTYGYDALGQLVSQTNANNMTHEMTYDLSGKLLTRTGPEGLTTYEYYTSGAGINLLRKVTGFSGSIKEYTYDTYGNLSSLKERADATDYLSSYTYNPYGDPFTVTYPSGFGIKYQYNATGYLTHIKNLNESVTLFTTNGLNGAGQVTSYTLGNGRTATRNYKYGYPLAYTTSGLQQLEMTWNYATGNFMKRKDILKNKEESFTYDPLDRLSSATVTGQATQNFTFANDGNITSKTSIGNYGYTGPKPHAVTEVTNASGTISNSTQNISYTAFLQPNTISEVNNYLSYTYGDDYQRIKSVFKLAGTVKNTRYYLNGYDADITAGVTRYVHYISGPAGLSSIVVSEAGTDKYYYVYTDHLGSLLTVSDAAAAIVTEQSFDAWGQRRDPLTWINWPPHILYTTYPAWLFRGYTGHEHIDAFGLINMNGRLYDPALGRVLSPDNFVQDSFSTQDFNRYSYAKNSPLLYHDPDGQFFLLFTQMGYNLQKALFPVALKLNIHMSKEQLGVGFDFSFGMPTTFPISHRIHFGATYYARHYDNSFKGWETRSGAQLSHFNGLVTLSGTKFKSGETSQTLNHVNIGTITHNIQYENDFFFDLVNFDRSLSRVLPAADGGDRFRTTGVQINWMGASIGINLFTGDPGLDTKSRSRADINNRKHYVLNTETGTDPDKYRMGNFYIGFGPFRIGSNSEANRNFFQNKLAHDRLMNPKVPYFKVLPERKKKRYFYFGFGTGNTTW